MHKTLSLFITSAIIFSSIAPLAQAQYFNAPLAPGSQGADVTKLQEILIQKGYLNVPATGYFGALTKAALANFQSAQGLEPIGLLGPKTRALLNSTPATTSSSPTASSPVAAESPTFTLGQKGTSVQTLQRTLKQEGFYTYPEITGYYGPLTKIAHDAYLAAQKKSKDEAAAKVTAEKKESEKTKTTNSKRKKGGSSGSTTSNGGSTVTPPKTPTTEPVVKNPTTTTPPKTTPTTTTPPKTTTPPVVTPPTPTPTPVSTGSTPKYKPPVLTNPTTITLGTGYTSTKLDNTKDYIIKFPSTRKTGATHITGGRNRQQEPHVASLGSGHVASCIFMFTAGKNYLLCTTVIV